jgi:hypothetical protein
MATASRIPISVDGTTSVPSEWFIARITEVGTTQSGGSDSNPNTGLVWQEGESDYFLWDGGDGTNILMWSEYQCKAFAHAWIEQQICKNGYNYEDMPQSIARYGTISPTVSQPAFALDGSKGSIDSIVLMRSRSIGASNSTIFEFLKSEDSSSSSTTADCPHVSSVQCTGGILTVTYDTTCVTA